MRAHRVLLVDDNQIFGSQVVAAFAESASDVRDGAQVAASWVARLGEALPLLDPALAAGGDFIGQELRLLILDFVRPASGGRQLIEQLQAIRARAPAGWRPPQLLVLVPVSGSYGDLPAGVEVQVKPIFPSQVVTIARRLLGLVASPLPASGTARPLARPVASHQLSLTPVPLSGRPAAVRSDHRPLRAIDDVPTAAHLPLATELTEDAELLDAGEDSSDFGPADTLLGPSNIEELARAMVRSAAAGDELLDAAGALTTQPNREPPPWAKGQQLPAPRTPTRRQFPALDRSLADAELAEAPTTQLPRPGDLTSDPVATSVSPNSQLSLTGDLALIPLIDIVALLARQQQSGLLEVVVPRATATATTSPVAGLTIWIAWHGGRIEQCLASGLPSLRLGRFVTEAAPLSYSQIDELMLPPSGKAGADELLGQRLCRAGLLRPDELRQILTRQSTELLYEALRQAHGRFSFDHQAALPAHVTQAGLGGALGLDAEALLLEGYRRIRDYHLLAKDAHDGAVYVSTAPISEPVGRLGLSHAELVVLGLCNGRFGQAEIARESALPELEVTRTIQRLLSLRLVRRRLPALLAS